MAVIQYLIVLLLLAVDLVGRLLPKQVVTAALEVVAVDITARLGVAGQALLDKGLQAAQEPLVQAAAAEEQAQLVVRVQ
jgi:hypothetical protein